MDVILLTLQGTLLLTQTEASANVQQPSNKNFEPHWTFHNNPHDYIFQNKHDIELWNLGVLFQGSCIGYLSGVI